MHLRKPIIRKQQNGEWVVYSPHWKLTHQETELIWLAHSWCNLHNYINQLKKHYGLEDLELANTATQGEVLKCWELSADYNRMKREYYATPWRQ